MGIDVVGRMALEVLGAPGAALVQAVREGPVALEAVDGRTQLVALSTQDFDRISLTLRSLSTGLWAAVYDMARIMGLADDEISHVLGMDVEEWHECAEVRGINPMSDAGQRGLLFIESYRALVNRVERKDMAAWFRAVHPALGSTPLSLLLGDDGARRLRDFSLRIDGPFR